MSCLLLGGLPLFKKTYLFEKAVSFFPLHMQIRTVPKWISLSGMVTVENSVTSYGQYSTVSQ